MKFLYTRDKPGSIDYICYPIDHFEVGDYVFEHKRDIGSGVMWCSVHQHHLERGDGSCGVNNCSLYTPRNGNNGRCHSLDNTFIYTDRKFLITKKGLKQDIDVSK